MKLRNKKTGRVVEVAEGSGGADWEAVTEEKGAQKTSEKASRKAGKAGKAAE